MCARLARPPRWLALLLVTTLLLTAGVPAADAAQKSVRAGNQLATTPGSADTLAAGGAKLNDHGHEFDEAFLTNKTGGSAVNGDVYAVDTATDSAFVAGDTVSSLQKFVVVVDDTIANNAAGKTARAGIVSAKANGAIARGQFVRKSATAKAIEDAGVALGAATKAPSGAVGVALSAAAGGFVTIMLFAETSPGASGLVLLDRDVTLTEAVSTTTETSAYSFTVAGGTLSTTNALRITVLGDFLNNAGAGAQSVTVKIKYGTTIIGTYTLGAVASIATRYPWRIEQELSAANATGAQYGAGHATLGSPGVSGGAVSGMEVNSMSMHNSIGEDSTVGKALVVTITNSLSNASVSSRVLVVVVEKLSL